MHICFRPNSIDSKRSKSLGNEDESNTKKDVKKTVSNPAKLEASLQEDANTTEVETERPMTVEESVSPAKGCPTPEARNPERCESPRPGCSSQQDPG